MKRRHGKIFERGHGVGTVTREMVHERARELAAIYGRAPDQILSSDWDEARRELTGEITLNSPDTPAEELTEDQRWEPVATSSGEMRPKVEPPDEQTMAEELVEEGVAEAEEEQMEEAAHLSAPKRRKRQPRKGRSS